MKPATWIPDAHIKQCYECNSVFGMFRRKHHCRVCGRVFCYECSKFRMIIPICLESFIPNSPSWSIFTADEKRLCRNCCLHVKKLQYHRDYLTIFSLLPLSIRDSHNLRVVDRRWRTTVDTMLSIFRNIQFKIHKNTYNPLEQNYLKTRAFELSNHGPWWAHVLNSSDITIKSDVSVTCKELGCSKNCDPKLRTMELLSLKLTDGLLLKDISIEEHLQMYPWWIQNELLWPTLVELSQKSETLSYLLFFESFFYPHLHYPHIDEDMKKAKTFTTMLENLKKTIDIKCTLDSFFDKFSRVKLPWDPNTWVIGVSSVTNIKSSTNPVCITFNTFNGSTHSIIVKWEDVRPDRTCMTVAYWMNQLTDVDITRYKIFSISSKCGVLELIPNATTLYDVSKSTTLLNYILDNKSNMTIESLRESFVDSVVGASMFAYTVGVGDRHLQNILITKDAKLVHVDFSFLLGRDPKNINTPIRITECMLDALGGKESETFSLFVQKCKKIYQDLRPYARFWKDLLDILDGDAVTHVMSRFIPGEWNSAANVQIETVVHSASASSWTHTLSDLSHSAALMFNLEL